MKVKVSKEATEELINAAVWYELEIPGLGEQLIHAFEQAAARLGEPSPPLVPESGEAAKLGAKRFILQRFPFSIVVVTNSQEVIVVAFAHHSRRPGYWRERVPS